MSDTSDRAKMFTGRIFISHNSLLFRNSFSPFSERWILQRWVNGMLTAWRFLKLLNFDIIALPESKFGPEPDRPGSLRRLRVGEDFGRPRLHLYRMLLLVFVRHGKTQIRILLEVHPGQEVSRYVLGLHPGTGTHLGFSLLVDGDEPLSAGAVVPVDERGVCVVAVLLEALPELAVVREGLLKTKDEEQGNRGEFRDSLGRRG